MRFFIMDVKEKTKKFLAMTFFDMPPVLESTYKKQNADLIGGIALWKNSF